MDARRLTDTFSVASQISLAEIAALPGLGFRSLICNRPDGEAGDQPSYELVAIAAEAAGLKVRHLPIVTGQMTDADASRFAGLLATLPGPTLAFCRSGTRSASLWALGEAGHRPVAEIVAMAAAANVDLRGLTDRLEARAASR